VHHDFEANLLCVNAMFIYFKKAVVKDAFALAVCVNRVYIRRSAKQKTESLTNNQPDERDLPPSYTVNAAEMSEMLFEHIKSNL
jgi:hypothetical protein